MSKQTKFQTYILMTEDQEVIWFGPSSEKAAQQTAFYEAKQRGKAVHYAAVKGTASGVLARLEQAS